MKCLRIYIIEKEGESKLLAYKTDDDTYYTIADIKEHVETNQLVMLEQYCPLWQ